MIRRDWFVLCGLLSSVTLSGAAWVGVANRGDSTFHYRMGGIRSSVSQGTREQADALRFTATTALLDRSSSHKLHVRHMHTSVRFLFAHPSTEQDADMEQVEQRGVLEPGITALWQGLIGPACASANKPALVVDVGVNWGYYTTLSSQLGCRVIGFEPLSLFTEVALLNAGILNTPRSNVKLFPTVVSGDPALVTICMPDGTQGGVILGTAGVNGANGADWANNKICTNHTPLSLSDIIREDVCLLKVDVEGMEPFVLQSAERLLRNYNVQNIIIEFSPGLTDRPGLPSKAHLIQMLTNLIANGYSIYEVGWKLAKTLSAVENDWASAYNTVRRGARYIRPARLEAFTGAVDYNTNLWICKPQREGSPCGGCP